MFQPSFGLYFGRLAGPDSDGTGCMPGGLSPCGLEAGAPPDCVSILPMLLCDEDGFGGSLSACDFTSDEAAGALCWA
jgi:hypothetical protein